MLTNQVAIVTGCSSGIGLALALELRRQGHRVFATARRRETVETLEREGLETARLDVTDDESIRQAIGSVMERAGRVDLLINNAGINLFGPLAELPMDRVRALVETNIVGLLAVCQAVFPHMALKRSGRIVNVGSVAGLLPTPFAGIYCASKAAVHMLSDVLRMEVAPFGIDVIVVQPGGVRSNLTINGSVGLERYRSASSRYHAVYAGIENRANASQDGAMETEEFARNALAEILQDKVPRVVRLGTGADVLPELAKLPGEQLDGIMNDRYNLDALVSGGLKSSE